MDEKQNQAPQDKQEIDKPMEARKSDAEREAAVVQNKVKVISPGRMVMKRFFRSKLSLVSLGFLVFLFLFSFIGPFLTYWDEYQPDNRPGEAVVVQVIYGGRTRINSDTESMERLLIQMLSGKTGIAPAVIELAQNALNDPNLTEAQRRAASLYNDPQSLRILFDNYGEHSLASTVPVRLPYTDGLPLAEQYAYMPAGGGIFMWPSRIPGGAPVRTPFTVVEFGTGLRVYLGAIEGEGRTSRVFITERTQIRHSNNPTERNINARPNFGDRSQPLGQRRAQLLGTDTSGYDILTRLMYGGRISLTLGFLSVAISLFLGLLFGGLAGYFGGWVDNLVMRIVDILSCLPWLPVLLIFSAILDGMPNIPQQFRVHIVMAVFAFISWPGTTRIVRGQIMSLREQEFMVATEALGLPVSRRITKHLIPNVMPLLIVGAVTSLGSAILTEASLSFLGLGVRQPHAAWGLMIQSVRQPIIMIRYPNQWIPAGVLIVMAVLAFGFLGDSLRDAFDPKSKR